MKTYAQLDQDTEICIYQAFANVTAETPTQMGNRINSAGFDADDNRGVLVLADAYGLDVFEAFHGSDLLDGSYNLEAGKYYVLIVTPANWAKARVKAVSAEQGINTGSAARRLLEDCPGGVTWHAIYAQVNGLHQVVWQDPQRIYRHGPTGNTVAVAITS